MNPLSNLAISVASTSIILNVFLQFFPDLIGKPYFPKTFGEVIMFGFLAGIIIMAALSIADHRRAKRFDEMWK
ncbi:hypothetical protein OTK49_01015 [Vibrio coralliirubri]|uniref:hypothetical protein n=1 Tax=Vibrio coralliirubri TaxID=1516159 RepID=UPI002284877C|nr:hypothetical protein [Vibrio coralliirubri]MCY9861111.1 hypothetical protein [Vibrio coralliirubri]